MRKILRDSTTVGLAVTFIEFTLLLIGALLVDPKPGASTAYMFAGMMFLILFQLLVWLLIRVATYLAVVD